jgi:hypothetical protein
MSVGTPISPPAKAGVQRKAEAGLLLSQEREAVESGR